MGHPSILLLAACLSAARDLCQCVGEKQKGWCATEMKSVTSFAVICHVVGVLARSPPSEWCDWAKWVNSRHLFFTQKIPLRTPEGPRGPVQFIFFGPKIDLEVN